MQEYSYFPMDGIASPSQGQPPSIKFVDTHRYTWMERAAARVQCFAQEHNTLFLEKA